ncbi:MAG: diacylglycerol kinase family protein [Spirochaetota bacterium]
MRTKFVNNRRGTATKAVINKIYSKKRSHTSVFIKLSNSFFWSMKGLLFAVKNERSLQIELGIAALAIALGVIAGITPGKWIVLVFSIGLMLICELINTAMELICDHMVKKQYDKTIEIVKDIMSGTVLLCTINLTVLGVIILIIPIVERIIAIAAR